MESNLIFCIVILTMIEVLVFVFLVLIVLVGIFAYSSYSEKKAILDAENQVVSAKERLKIAERKFMQGKIKKSVFESLIDDIEEELLLAELALFRLKNYPEVSITEKASQVFLKMDRPTKYRKIRIEKILTETELIRNEISILEGKFMKHEIKQSVFERLIKTKEDLMIRKEKELMDVVAGSADEKKILKKMQDAE